MLQFLHRMFNVSSLLLGDALLKLCWYRSLFSANACYSRARFIL